MVRRTRPQEKKAPNHLFALASLAILSIASPAMAQIAGLPSIPGIAPLPAAPLTPDQLVGNVQGPVGVTQRQQPQAQQAPFNYRGIGIFPSWFEIGTFDSNIYASSQNHTSDFILRSRPDIRASNAPGSNVLGTFDMYAEYDKYVAHSNLSNVNAGASANIGDDFGDGLTGISRTAYNYEHQDPAGLTTNTAGLALRTLPAISEFNQEFGLDKEFEPVGLIFDASYTRTDLQNIALANGVTQNQTQLNGNVLRAGPKVAWNFAPDLRPYLQGTYARYAYDNGALSANEYQGVAGADFSVRQLLGGTVFGGYKTHVYDRAIPTASGPTFGVNLTWFAREDLTLSATGAQTYYDSTLRTGAGLPSTIDTNNVAFEADYLAFSNVIVSGIGSYENDAYSGISRTDNVYSVGAGLQYLITPNLTTLAQYQFSDRQSNASLFSYNRNTISIGAKLSF